MAAERRQLAAAARGGARWRRCSGRLGARRRGGGASRRPGDLGDPGARGGTAGASTEAARDGTMAAAAPNSRGEMAGKEEGRAEKLTGDSI